MPDPQESLRGLSCKTRFASRPEDFGDDIGGNSLLAVPSFKSLQVKNMSSFLR